jgi:hypothetical protein
MAVFQPFACSPRHPVHSCQFLGGYEIVAIQIYSQKSNAWQLVVAKPRQLVTRHCHPRPIISDPIHATAVPVDSAQRPSVGLAPDLADAAIERRRNTLANSGHAAKPTNRTQGIECGDTEAYSQRWLDDFYLRERELLGSTNKINHGDVRIHFAWLYERKEVGRIDIMQRDTEMGVKQIHEVAICVETG